MYVVYIYMCTYIYMVRKCSLQLITSCPLSFKCCHMSAKWFLLTQNNYCVYLQNIFYVLILYNSVHHTLYLCLAVLDKVIMRSNIIVDLENRKYRYWLSGNPNLPYNSSLVTQQQKERHDLIHKVGISCYSRISYTAAHWTVKYRIGDTGACNGFSYSWRRMSELPLAMVKLCCYYYLPYINLYHCFICCHSRQLSVLQTRFSF